MRYRPEIDGLRAVAVVPVILFHAGLGGLSGGYVGVDVFFVISGFLITSILLEDIHRDRYSLLRFYERRARRILPALAVVIAVTTIAAWQVMSPDQMREYAKSVLAAATFSSNILFLRSIDYFAPSAETLPLLHTWSLAVEEQFYLVFPVVLALAMRAGRRVALTLVALAAFASLVWSQWSLGVAPDRAYYLIGPRAWELLLGALVAFAVRRSGERRSEILSAAGLAAILCAVLVYDEATPFPGLAALLPAGGSALILWCATSDTRVGRLLAHPAPVAIGLVSYSAYLWHQPLFALARLRALGTPDPWVMMALSALTFALAGATWWLVEQPARSSGRVGPRSVYIAAPVLLALGVAFGAAGYVTGGFRDQITTPEQRAVLATARPSPMRAACHASATGPIAYDDACTYPDGTANVAVFGDSHSVELAYALSEELRPDGRAVRHLTFSGCTPSLVVPGGAAPSPCATWTSATLDRLERDEGIGTVVVSYRIARWLTGPHTDHFPDLPASIPQAEADRAWGDLTEILTRLRTHGKDVILVLQSPELPARVEAMVMQAGDPAEVDGVPRAWWAARNAPVLDRIGDVPKGVAVLDPTDLFCGAVSCAAVAGGTALYFDDNHLSVGGAARVAGAVRPMIGARD